MNATENDLKKVQRSAKQNYDITLDLRQDWSFFTNKFGEFELNKVCSKCKHSKICGQSFKVKIEWCKKFEDKNKKQRTTKK